MTPETFAEVENCLKHGRCRLCGGFIGPGIGCGAMCYRCAPPDARPDVDWAMALVQRVRELEADLNRKNDALATLTRLDERAACAEIAEALASAIRARKP